MIRIPALSLCLALCACQSRGGGPAVDSAKATTTPAMSGMSGMSTMNAAAMDSMRADMGRMRAMTPEQMKAALPAHRQTTANMLAQMNADMRSMNMPAAPSWTALVDSVRQDLIRLPELPASQLASALPSHTARVERLMATHQHMMTNGTSKL